MFKSAYLGFSLFLGALQLPLAGQESTSPKELIQYVRDAKKAGLKETQIQQNAIQAGWTEQDIKGAIASLHVDPAKLPGGTPVNPKTSPGSKTNSDAPVTTTSPQLTPAATPVTETPTAATAPAAPPQTTPSGAAATATGSAAPQETPAQAAPTASTPQVAPSGSTGKGPAKPDVINRGVPDEYRIGEGDVVQVNVWGEPTASVPSVVVRPDGKITIPLVKDISVAGLTPAEAEKTITEQLSKQIKAADVTVIVNQINSKKIFVVGGGVKKEGPINFTYRMTVMQALSEAGGLTDYAKRKKIYVLRNENGRQYQLKFDYDAVLKGEHMETNIPMIPGDTLVVPNH